jgi:amidohydrolase
MVSNNVEQWKERSCAAVESRRAQLIELSMRIHDCPELKFEEHRSSAWLAAFLESVGFAVERPAYGMATAFVARQGSGRPRVAILCEYDALPGIGHGCGHNIIATAGVGAAAALGDLVSETGGTLIVLGTPAEEGGGGKILMAQRGAFEGIDAAMMVHPAGMDLAAMPALAFSLVEVEYRGRAAHASAFPHRGINALDALVTAYNAIAQLRQHIRATERIHGIITDGGQAPNVVPERAAGVFCIRAATAPQLARLKERVLACFHAGAQATGAQVNLQTVGDDYSDLWTNAPLAAAYAANLVRLGRTVLDIADVPSSIAGSTDMGNVSKLVPAIHPMIAAAPRGVPLHSADFARYAGAEDGHRAVIDGAKALAMTALDVFGNPGLVTAMQAAFAQTVARNRS